MTVLNLKGGLGNQIFQYLAALKFALGKNDKLHIYTGNLKSFKTKRNFSLEVFIKNSPIEVVILEKKKVYLGKYLLWFLKTINFNIISEKNFFSKSKYLINIIDDYFLSSKFLDDDLILNLKEALEKQYGNLVSESLINNGIGIHIRGTDRLAENMEVNYSNFIDNLLISEDKKIYCFTDDLKYAKSKLGGIKNKIIYISEFNYTDIEEFYLISKMDKFIVSNSTFSVLARRMSSNNTITYVNKDLFTSRDTQLLEVFNFNSTIVYN